MQAVLGKILADGSDLKWGQVHEFEPVDVNLRGTFGKLITVVKIDKESNPPQMELAEAGKEILRRLNELYYGGEGSGGVLVKIKGAVEKTEAEFPGTEIAALSVMGNAIYFTVTKGMRMWAKKEGKTGWVVRGENLEAGSGWVKEGEVVVVGEKAFWDSISEIEVVKALENDGGMEEIVENIMICQRSKGMGGGVGVVIRILKPEIVNQVKEEVRVEFKPKTSLGERWQKVREKIKTRTSQGGVYVINQGNTNRPKMRKRMMMAGAACLVVWLGLVGIGQIRNSEIKEKTSVEYLTIGKIVTKYEEAKAVTGLDPSRSKQLLAEVKVDMDTLGEKGKKDERIIKIAAEYGKVLGEATGVKEVIIREVVDLGLVREDANGGGLAIGDGGKLWVADMGGNRLIMVNPESGAGTVSVGKESLGQIKLVATYPGKIEILSDKGIVECVMANSECVIKIKPDEKWNEIGGMKVWAGNIYLLDRGARQIWKYMGSETGFGTRQEWLGEVDESLSTSLSQSTGMAIDGSIWSLAGGRDKFLKFTRGVGEVITISNLDQAVGEGAVLYTNDDLEKIYILDPINNRVVGVTKAGVYEKAWTNEKLREMKDVVVDEKKGKMWLVGGKKVVEIAL